MKVPKMYKSSDRYNAGTDVIYDDDSKVQFAPFIYATAESGDNGADEGGDEEGEDSMIITYDSTNNRYDKKWQEVKDASIAGKTVMLIVDMSNRDDDPYTAFSLYYLTEIGEDDGEYFATFMGSYNLTTVAASTTYEIPHTVPLFLEAQSASDYLVNSQNAG